MRAAHASESKAPLRRDGGLTAYELRRELQAIAAEKVGVLRNGEALTSRR